MKQRLAWLGFCALALGGCSLAPVYHVPETPTPVAYKEKDGWVQARPEDDKPKGDWWKRFQDPDLDMLESKVGLGNQNLKVALARLEEARAGARGARAAYYPQVAASGYMQDARISVDKPFYFPFFSPVYQDNFLGGTVSYELDVWGQIRNSVVASDAMAASSAADMATLELSIRAELASDYFALRGYDRNLVLLGQLVDVFRQVLDLTQKLYEGGGASATDVAQARLQLQNGVTQITDERLKRSQLEHAMATLVGEPASSFSIAPGKSFVISMPNIDVGMPSILLQRRPDIASAERQVVAANAEIGVARAAFFPVFGLNVGAGLESQNISNWMTAPSRLWSVGPSVALPLFDGGQRQSVTDRAHAALDGAAANYRQTVLKAYQEVEDNLSAMRELNHELKSAGEADAAARDTLDQADHRYQGGIASYLEDVTARSVALQSDLELTDIQVRYVTASVQLIKALGGDWQTGAKDQTDMASVGKSSQ